MDEPSTRTTTKGRMCVSGARKGSGLLGCMRERRSERSSNRTGPEEEAPCVTHRSRWLQGTRQLVRAEISCRHVVSLSDSLNLYTHGIYGFLSFSVSDFMPSSGPLAKPDFGQFKISITRFGFRLIS